MRIDKLLSNLGYGSRKEIHKLIKDSKISINNKTVKSKQTKINLNIDILKLNDEIIDIRLIRYIKLNKPAGYITAVEDSTHKTIMDLLPKGFKSLKVFPVGRLDKDTEGLILLTNDGKWAHKVINGQKDVSKKYYFEYTGELSQSGLKRIEEGMILGDGSICKPALLELLDNKAGYLTITEGKYHQVKRMIGACEGKVTYLKRVSIGQITLDNIRETSNFIDLSPEEIASF